ncbi:hypothetical protein ABPG77_010719 [Micractinium sp. CCAP 211/92]
MASTSEFAACAPLIARYFGSPVGKSAASAVTAAVRTAVASGPPAPVAARGAASTTTSPVMQVLNASAAKAPSPVFVLPTSQPKTSGYMHMRMHSSMQSK